MKNGKFNKEYGKISRQSLYIYLKEDNLDVALKFKEAGNLFKDNNINEIIALEKAALSELE